MYLYDPTSGGLKIADKVEQIPLTTLSLNSSSLHIPELIFRSATLINWEEMQQHHSLNDIFSVVTKQKRVMRDVGLGWNGDVKSAASEKIEHKFENGFLHLSQEDM